MTEPILIADPDDPRIAPYRAIRERDLAGRQGRFVAEGQVVLEKAIRLGRRRLESVLLAQGRVAGLRPLLAELPEDTPIYTAAQTVMDAVVGFPIHRGVLAVGRRAPEPDPGQLLAGLGPQASALGLVGIANHDNMGGLFRNAAAFGVGAVVLDAACCDPLYRKAIRTSVGASLIVPFARLAPGGDMLALFEAAGFAPLALSPGAAETLSAVGPAARTAVLVGAEGPGLPSEMLQRARAVSIPMAGGFDSLNVATAAAIVLHHLARA